MRAYDCLIGDEVVVRPDEEAHYTEQIARVPGTYLTFDVANAVPPVEAAPARRNGHVTFGCFASQYKLTPQVGTYAEQGFEKLTSGDNYAVFVNGKTRPALQEHISAAVRKALTAPALVSAFAKAYIEPVGSTQAEAVRLAHADNAHWATAIKTIGYVPES